MNHEHEFGTTDFWNETTSCECGESRKATAEELAYELKLIDESERKHMQNMDMHLQDLRDTQDALSEM